MLRSAGALWVHSTPAWLLQSWLQIATPHTVSLYVTPEAFSASFTAAVIMLLALYSLQRGLHLPATQDKRPCRVADRFSHP